MRPLLDELPSVDVPFDERVPRWVRVWARIQEEIAPIRWRALVAEDQHPELQPELAELRKRHRAEITRDLPRDPRPPSASGRDGRHRLAHVAMRFAITKD